MNSNLIDYHHFVDEKLAEIGFRIVHITEEMMAERIDDFMAFVNGIRNEYSSLYGWNEESREYFLNPLKDKFKYSFAIVNGKNEICFASFSSVYNKVIHYHFAYAGKNTRGLNFAKIHMIKFCQTCLDSGFTHLEGYFPKSNNGSIILFLKMGWQIENVRNNKELFMIADLQFARDRTYDLLLSEK
jgi:hypothetical protein